LTVGTAAVVADVSQTQIFVVNFPVDQQMVTVTLNTTEDVTLAGSWGFALAFTDNTRCSATTDTFINAVILQCMAVPAGNFYIALENDFALSSAGVIKVTTQSCATGFSGINCLNQLIAFDATKTYTGTVSAYNATVGLFPQVIFYTDFAINSSLELNITMDNTTGFGGNLVLRAGSFPYMDIGGIVTDRGGEGVFFQEVEPFPAGILFNFGDSYVGGRYYWSIANTDPQHPMEYSMTSVSQTGTSSGSSTTAATSGKSAASSIAVPVLLLASILAGLIL